MTGVAAQRVWWREHLTACGFDPAPLLWQARIGARLMPDPGGTSGLCGVPRMPRDWRWPEWDDRPLQYIAHVSLRALSAVVSDDGRHGLPDSGTLHLFADALGNGWGFDETHEGSFAAFTGDGDVTFTTPHATDDHGNVIPLDHPAQPMALVPELVLPSPHSDAVHGLGEERLDAYWDLYDAFNDEHFDGAPKHRICGLADVLDPPDGERLPHGTDWRLLAQIDTDADWFVHRTMGRFQWWLGKADFRANRVHQCWGTVQLS